MICTISAPCYGACIWMYALNWRMQWLAVIAGINYSLLNQLYLLLERNLHSIPRLHLLRELWKA